MAILNLNLDKLKFAGVSNFSRNFGEKKVTNGGSLTTYEFNEANALPFDNMRPIIVTEDSSAQNVQADRRIILNSSGVKLTLNTTGCVEGITLSVYAETSGEIYTGTTKLLDMSADDYAELMFINSAWKVAKYPFYNEPAFGNLKHLPNGVVANSIRGYRLTGGTVSPVSNVHTFVINNSSIKSLFDGMSIKVFCSEAVRAASEITTVNIQINEFEPVPIKIGRSGGLRNIRSTQMQSTALAEHYNSSAPHLLWQNVSMELIYSSTDNAFIVVGNPVFISSMNNGNVYTVKADWYKEVRYKLPTVTSNAIKIVTYPFVFNSKETFSMWYSQYKKNGEWGEANLCPMDTSTSGKKLTNSYANLMVYVTSACPGLINIVGY